MNKMTGTACYIHDPGAVVHSKLLYTIYTYGDNINEDLGFDCRTQSYSHIT